MTVSNIHHSQFPALVMSALAFFVPIAQVALVKAVLANGIKSKL
jgi:hypothetical protein